LHSKRPLTDTALAGRKPTRIEFAPYATDPDTKVWIKVAAQTASAHWASKTIGNDAHCEVSAPRHSLDLALAEKGIAVLPPFIGDAQPTLQRVGETIPELTHDQWIVTHSDDQHCPRIPTGCALYCSHDGLKHTFD
tara:strand:+ start:131 stop:538 length:408 start_codon:yes stop_codon:yes gene_type:complete